MGESYPSRSEYRKKKQQKNKKGKRFKKLAIRTGMALFIAFILLFCGLAATAIALIKDAPSLHAEKLIDPQASTIYDMNDKKLFDIAGEEYRKIVPLERVPERVQNAFLAVEDVRFWDHPGIDVKRIGGALVVNVKEGFGAEGASTITQQLVKLSYLTPEKTIKRKVQEMYLAFKLERKYPKEKILEMYLNKVYFGEGTYGVAAAAEVFFQKPLEELTISEAALLAGLPQRPSAYNPFKNPELAEERRNTVLALMERHGFISKKEKNEAQSIPVEDMLNKKTKEIKYRSFVDHIIEELDEHGLDEKAIYTQGLKIYTTLDPDAQELTENVLMTDEYVSYPNDDKLRAAVALIDTQTGEIRALGGKRDAKDEEIERGFNYATQLKKQPGSTAKPIMAYGPAIEKLKWPTSQIIEDAPLELNGKAFRNWNNQYHGNVTMRTALKWSYNIPAIKAMQAAGAGEAKKFAANLGIELEQVYPAYAIGGFSEGVSPLQMAGAYAAFGNNGVYNKPHAVRKIVFPDGKEQELKPESRQAMSDYTAYMITDMLKSVVTQGTGQSANIPGLPLAGKTGTNQLPDRIVGPGAADAWFVGYTTRFTASVWVGYDEVAQDSYLKNEDTRLARIIFKEIMSRVSDGIDTPDFKMPSSVVRSGGELYVRGSQPVRPPNDSANDKPDQNESREPETEENEERDDPPNEAEHESEPEDEGKPQDSNSEQDEKPRNEQPPKQTPPERPKEEDKDNEPPEDENDGGNDDEQENDSARSNSDANAIQE